MPVEFYNLGINLYHAEGAQQSQNLVNHAERAGAELASDKVKKDAEEKGETVVQETEETENTGINSEEKGGGTHSSQNKSSKEDDEDTDPPPPDPEGRGHFIDFQV